MPWSKGQTWKNRLGLEMGMGTCSGRVTSSPEQVVVHAKGSTCRSRIVLRLLAPIQIRTSSFGTSYCTCTAGGGTPAKHCRSRRYRFSSPRGECRCGGRRLRTRKPKEPLLKKQRTTSVLLQAFAELLFSGTAPTASAQKKANSTSTCPRLSMYPGIPLP